MCPVVRYTQIGGSAAGPTAVAGSAFTFGEGTLVTCWHCLKQPLAPDEFYGIAVPRGPIQSPYEFCSIDNLKRDHNGADVDLGHIDWMPGVAAGQRARALGASGSRRTAIPFGLPCRTRYIPTTKHSPSTPGACV